MALLLLIPESNKHFSFNYVKHKINYKPNGPQSSTTQAQELIAYEKKRVNKQTKKETRETEKEI